MAVISMEHEIKREYYLEQLINRKNNSYNLYKVYRVSGGCCH